jgi:hypothetical protein
MACQPTPRSATPSVFISYARSDGSDYAFLLRRKLQEEHPDIELWQDIISERAGRDWWLQITDALNHTANRFGKPVQAVAGEELAPPIRIDISAIPKFRVPAS